MQRSDRLRCSAVGVIGCRGTGSPAIEVLARAGVGTFVLVDPQRISPSNLERMYGAYDSDITQPFLPYKVEILRRHILAINPKANFTNFVGNIWQDNVMDELLRCDVLLVCTDSSPERVALSDIAKHFLLPSIDVGVDMSGADGRITNQLADFTTYSPDSPCRFCYRLINSMARKANAVPSYLLHASSGEARFRINGRDHLLGPLGSESSRIRYGELIAQLASGIPIDPFSN